MLFVNNLQEGKQVELETYLNNFISKFKEINKMDTTNLFKESVGEKVVLAVSIWFFGTTVIRNTNSFWNSFI